MVAISRSFTELLRFVQSADVGQQASAGKQRHCKAETLERRRVKENYQNHAFEKAAVFVHYLLNVKQ